MMLHRKSNESETGRRIRLVITRLKVLKLVANGAPFFGLAECHIVFSILFVSVHCEVNGFKLRWLNDLFATENDGWRY